MMMRIVGRKNSICKDQKVKKSRVHLEEYSKFSEVARRMARQEIRELSWGPIMHGRITMVRTFKFIYI